ncbi:hypothetical protein [Aureliella helgolandensis]|uniref:Glutamine amidotransferase domain-containing protein n=1 Tax=Aureliella helgolandensis TaxID=2527968 RepID=A0A518FZR6_9BACT|nr:hypothetical protein [Aureliella helgolandensis]QDV21843.1 hypothetical protein Q31a_01220 [Aureliella helgolandensis]
MINPFFSQRLLSQISVEPLFGWLAWLPLALVMLASLWLTLTSTGVSRSGRWVLVLLRSAAMCVLLLGWLRPGVITTTERESAGAIAVLMDRSESMVLPGGASGNSRWQEQQGVWDAIVAATSLKIGESQLVPYFYDQELSRASTEDLPALSATYGKLPRGKLTDLGQALSELGRQQVEPPLRAVILMGDATQTQLPPRVDATVVARQMAQLDQPILVVGLGVRGEKSQLRDVAIEGLPESFSAFVKKELNVPLVIRALGMQNQPINLQLKLRSSGKPDQILASRTVLATGPAEQLPLEFKIVVPDAGEYLLEATATVDTQEQVESNNKAISFVSVREGGVNILYLEGQLRAEQAFLKRSLDESLDFQISPYYLPEKDRQKWPVDLSRTIDFDRFDAIIIGDLDAGALSPQTQQRLRRRVEMGAGLLLLGGYHTYSLGGYARSELASLFPVELNLRSQAWGAPVDETQHILGDVKLRPTRPNPITSLAGDPLDNARQWESLKPLQGMNRLGRVVAKPGVQVLLEDAEGEPALVTGEAGRGRVLAFAGDTTWRWWLGGQKKVHQQFWRQAMLWLIRRDTLNEGFRLDLQRRRLALGDTPPLSVEWFGGSENKAMPSEVKIELSCEGRWLQNLVSTKQSESMLQATLAGLEAPGLYRAALTATGADGTPYEADIAFVVRDESVELENPSADWQMMANIVSANAAAEGQLVLPEEIGQALGWLRERQDATKVTTIEKRRLGDAAWDAWLYLVLFCALMSVEWGLRKAWQLP